MKAAVFDGVRKGLRLCELPKPKADLGQIVIKVHACGICFSEVSQLHGHFPFARFPCVPGHEISGTVVETGTGVTWPPIGTRVGLPWLYSSCGHCDHCVRGNEVLCKSQDITGVTVNGGYAEYVVAPAKHVAPIPDELDFTSVAPIMCAGVTVFNALRRSGLGFGDRVAVLGTGGLGQLAVQYASAMGATVAAVSRGRGAEKTVREQGASHYIATTEINAADALQKWGGANVILNTAPSTKTANDAVGGLAPDGTLTLLGFDATPVTVPPISLIMGRARVMGSPSGSPQDLRDALRFAADHKIVPQITPIKITQAGDILNRMESGGLSGRAVIKFD